MSKQQTPTSQISSFSVKPPQEVHQQFRVGREKENALYLEASIQCALYGDTLGGVGPIGGDGRDEAVQLISLLLQLLHQALNGPLGEGL